jgi:hypothetical protein
MQQNEKILVYYEWNRAHDICFSCFVSTMHQNTHERLNETKGEQSRVCGNFSDVNKPREALWLGSPMEMRSRSLRKECHGQHQD